MGTSYQAAHSTASRVISDALLAVQSAASSSMMVNSHAIRPMSTRFVYQTYVPEETEVYHPCFAKGYIYTPKFSYSAARFPAIRAARQCLGGPAASETMTCGQISGRALNQGEDAGDERLYAVPAAHHENFQQGCSMLGGAMSLGLSPATAQV